MGIYYGAKYNLENLIGTHLFIICANNSGTTFLRNALATSRHTWNLQREGQHTYGFAGPSSIGLKAHKRWASDEKWISLFTDAREYDWDVTKRAWYFQSFSRSETAEIFVEKSPPFLLIVDQLVENFKDARFLFMVRNPYAVVEGLLRKSAQSNWYRETASSDLFKIAASHVVNCLRFQRKNIETWKTRGVFFTYEQMCENPETVENQIRKLVPKLDDLNLRQRIKVREYNEDLRNMNEQQITRLTTDDLGRVNEIFVPQRDLIESFGYSLRD
jgi:hypothetical protein